MEAVLQLQNLQKPLTKNNTIKIMLLLVLPGGKLDVVQQNLQVTEYSQTPAVGRVQSLLKLSKTTQVLT